MATNSEFLVLFFFFFWSFGVYPSPALGAARSSKAVRAVDTQASVVGDGS